MGEIILAVDAMGGDYAPGEIIAGAIQGARDYDIELSLVGEPAAIRTELSKYQTGDLALSIVPATDVIRMDEDPIHSVRTRSEASINVACRQLLEGRADGMLTMGHSGAGLIAAALHFGRIPGVERPAPIVPFLGLREDLYLVDAGANIQVRPRHLLQFAHMGTAFLRHVARIPKPRIGLLSNGSEPNKGNMVGQEAYSLLASADDIEFIGNVEGNTMFTGHVNLVVTDGFTGNVVFKTAEGIIHTLLAQVEEVITQLPHEAIVIISDHLQRLRARNDYARIGVSALLGVQYPIFIGHGRSRAIAVRNGMKTAKDMILADVVSKIRQAITPQDSGIIKPDKVNN